MTRKETEASKQSDREEIVGELESVGLSCASYLTSGGTADVYTAIDESHNRLVAVKVLAKALRDSEQTRSQFVTTSQRHQKLCQEASESPLVPVLAVGEIADSPYLVMPFAAGGTLRDRLQANTLQDNPARRSLARHVVTVLVEAVEPLHAAGIIHRDIKPSNLLVFANGSTAPSSSDAPAGFLAEDEFLRLSDFGLATSYRDLSYSGRLPAGTPGFAAPETLCANPNWTPSADLFSATMCIVEILLGESPGHDWQARLSASGYEKTLIRALEVGASSTPEHRPASVAEWGKELLIGLEYGASKRSHSALLLSTLAVTFALVAVVASVVWVNSRSSQTAETNPNVAVFPPVEESEPLAGPTLTCRFDTDQIPTAALGFADVGEGGAVPGEGDCSPINLFSIPSNVDSEIGWNEMEFTECQTLLAEENSVDGDYTVFIKPVDAPEIELRRNSRADFLVPVAIESIRVEISTEMTEGPENYLGFCRNSEKRDGFVQNLNFHFDETGETYSAPNRFPPN